MKKAFAILICIFALFLSACNNTDGPVVPGGKDLTYEEQWNKYINEIVPEEVSSKIYLGEEYIFEDGTIGFTQIESSNIKSISNKGLYFINIFHNQVDLVFTVYHESGDVYVVNKSVLAVGAMDREDYVKYVSDELIPDYVYKDIEFVTLEDDFFSVRGIEANITYTSSNENALTSEGKYVLETKDDVNVTISFVIEIYGFTLTGTKDVLVLGKNDELYISNAKKWLEDEFISDKGVYDDFVLPGTDEAGMVEFSWTSLSLDVIDNNGKFTDFSVDLSFKMQVDIKIGDSIETYEMDFRTVNTEEALEFILEKMHQEELHQSTFVTYVITSGYHNEDYGFLKFYTMDVNEDELLVSESDTSRVYGTKDNNSYASLNEIKDGIIPRSMSYKRPKIKKKSVEFVTVHDTGDNKYDAEDWMNEITTSSREVSWHFTVDDHDIYQHVPLDEVAFHAGDGSREFELLDTGVKYSVKDPVLEFNTKDNYLYINGIKSKLLAPTVEGKYYHKITPAGLYTCRGENGNYYIDAYHQDTTGYNVIASNGGNRNSIGIETCIVDGVKYSMVMRKTANLVAHLLTMYDLDTSRVMQHRNFSGKLCPQSMIRAKADSVFAYDNFMELVEIEYFILNCLPNVKFTYKSNNPDILDNNGNLLKYVSEETVISYDVTIEFNGKTISRTYQTTVFPK